MKIDAKIRSRITVLLERAPPLYMNAATIPGVDAKREAWLTSALHLLEVLAPNPLSPYRSRATTATINYIGMADNRVDMVCAVLGALIEDIDAGISPAIGDQVRGEVFDDFLSHAEGYLRANRTAPAGVIAGVVFEDTIRRGCDRHKINQKSVQLDQLIIALNRGGYLSDVKAQHARGAAAVRTKATHAQWDEFDAADVRATIQLTRDLITELLET
jgi:hypothetical protein